MATDPKAKSTDKPAGKQTEMLDKPPTETAPPAKQAAPGTAEVKAPGSSGQATAPAPERVPAEAPGTKDVHAGTDPGEQIAGTPAKGVEAPEGQGTGKGTFPEATPGNLPEQPAGAGNAKGVAQREDDVSVIADGGGQQVSGTEAMRIAAQEVGTDGKLADSAEGAKGAPTAEQAAQHAERPMLYIQGQDANVDGESPNRAIAENTPAVPENKRVAEGMAEALAGDVTDTKAKTTSFASRGRQAPHREPAKAK